MDIEKFKRITEGWKNIVFLSPTVEKLATERSKICSDCIHAVEKKWLKKIGSKSKRMLTIECSKCRCVVSAKTRSVKEECPLTPPKW